MNSAAEPTPKSLTWKQTGDLESRLAAGEEVVGTLRWEKGWGSLAIGESTEGNWTFKKLGHRPPKIVVRNQASNHSTATMTMGWRGGGVIELPIGQRFRLAPKGFWRSEWVLADHSQRRLFTMKPNFSWGKAEASVQIEDAALSIRELRLLAFLSWYAILLVSYDGSDGDGAIMASLVASGAI